MILWRGGIFKRKFLEDKKMKRKKKCRPREFPVLLFFSLTANFLAFLTYYLNCFSLNSDVFDSKFNLTRLKLDLCAVIFGQNEAINLFIDEMSKYLDENDVTASSKPLMMSVHGSSGTGKTKLTNYLIDLLPDTCVNKFIVPLHFIQTRKHLTSLEDLFFFPNYYCEFVFFIFEEVNFETDFFLNALKTILKRKTTVKTIILFTSVEGTVAVVDYFRRKLENNEKRENITQKELSLLIRNSWHDLSDPWIELLKLIVFLPLEKQHVRKCIITQLKEVGIFKSTKIVNFILENIHFLPNSQLIAENGCKKVDSYIKIFL